MVLGSHAFNAKDGDELHVKPARILTHPLFNTPKHRAYDFALIQLEHSVNLSETINIACLSSFTPTAGRSCTLIGWGRTSESNFMADFDRLSIHISKVL